MKLLAVILVLFGMAGTAHAGGYKEQGAWNFLSPLHKQFLLNREVLDLQEEGGVFDAKDYYYITQTNTNIGNITNIDGHGNKVYQDNDGDQNASNNVESDGNGNLVINEGGYYD